MNPIVKVKEATQYVLYQLTDRDMRRLKKVKLISGAGDSHKVVMHQMCIMQAAALVSVQADRGELIDKARRSRKKSYDRYKLALTDTPICVSPTICNYLIGLNDAKWVTPRQRNSLKKLIPDILNTRPIVRKQLKTGIVERASSNAKYNVAEKQRNELLNTDNIHGASYYDDKTHQWKKRDPISFAEAVAKIKEAAALYHVPDTGKDSEVVEIG